GQRALGASLDQHHGRNVQEPTLRIISRIRPQPEEVARNPRARSATLRVAERCYRQRQAAR
ncbi:MAG: 16S rRNA (cytosine(1402)-N(4))-methyltransferase, partial [Burkholderiaceae bacterium]|nr:16S rRNA (cytosine(1402)-N(4))-methyltransferase [Burkholderiaceae bacterium]